MPENRILAHLPPEFPADCPDAPPLTVWGVWISGNGGRDGWVNNTGAQDGRVFFPDRDQAEAEAQEMRDHHTELCDVLGSDEQPTSRYTVVRLKLSIA
jgi:hypothetical protein